jgi:hypothetical protein
MIKERLGRELLKLIEKNLDPSLFPLQKGDKINIGSFSIMPSKKGGYTVKCYKTNAIVAETYTKTAALAIAKTLSKKTCVVKRILELDNIISKNQIDCMFYKNTIKKTKNPVIFESTMSRYEICMQKATHAKEQLNKFIL